jgi:hypothetical protein
VLRSSKITPLRAPKFSLSVPCPEEKPVKPSISFRVERKPLFQMRGFGKKWIDGGTDPFPVLFETIKNKITRKREIPTPTPYCNS